jgi:Uncharacterized conserved protein related to C-terminal domain of eukaryotic chaperone, SACSIN
MIKRSKIGENVKRREERKAKLQASLDSIANQLKDCGALKIIHFGPLARGEVDVKSDLDLLAIMPSSKSGGEWTNFIYDNAEGKIDSKIIVYNEKEFEEELETNPFLENVVGSGRMVYEKIDKEEATKWFTQAKDEFEDADELRSMKKYYLALFHFQQSTEKAIKAYLYSKIRFIEIFYTHSIHELLKIIFEIDEDFKAIRDAKKLDRYYFPTRYPTGLPGVVPSRYFKDPEEAEEAMLLAKGVIDLVERKLNEKKGRGQ